MIDGGGSMLDAFSVVVPTLDRRVPGVLRPVDDARAGVLLLDGTGTQAPLVPRIFDELEMYLQAADLVTLRLSLPQKGRLARRVSGVLGGVSLLRTMCAGRVVVVTSALDPLSTWNEARAGTLAELMDLADQGKELPDIVRVVRDLTTTIREVADSTAGVATLVARSSQADGAPEAPPAIRALPRRYCDLDDAPGETRASPSALLLPLPRAEGKGEGGSGGGGGDATARRAVTALVSRLYSWSVALARAGGQSFATSGNPETRYAAQERSQIFDQIFDTWHSSQQMRLAQQQMWLAWLRWADEQWEGLLRELESRAPTVAQRVRMSAERGPEDRPGASLHDARHAWTLLDGEARYAWLRVCSAIFPIDPEEPIERLRGQGRTARRNRASGGE